MPNLRLVDPGVILGKTTPRIFTPPLVVGKPGPCGCGCALSESTSEGFAVEAFAIDTIHKPLDPWERWLVIHGMELLPDGRPRFRQLLILVARQNGKTFLLVILSLYWLWKTGKITEDFLVVGTSIKLEYAKESWDKAVAVALASPELAPDITKRLPSRKLPVRNSQGDQVMETPWRARYKIAAATETGGRSLTIHRLIEDEIREHHDWTAHEAAENAMNAVDDAQAWGISNEGDARSIVLRALYDSALAYINGEGGDERLFLAAWSAPKGCDLLDVEATAQANPNLGRRISWENLKGKAERAKLAGGDQEAHYRTEVLCMYVHSLDPGGISLESWAATSKIVQREDLGPPVFFITIGKNLKEACIASAADFYGTPHVELIEHREGVAWLSDRVKELRDQYKDAPFGAFQAGPVRSWVPNFADIDVELELLNTPDTVAACAHLQKLSESMDFTHYPDAILVDSLKGAQRRQLDLGGWVWDWSKSTSDLAPIAAITGALWLFEAHDNIEVYAEYE